MFSQLLRQAFDAGLENLGSGTQALGYPELDFGIENIHETPCIAWHVRV